MKKPYVKPMMAIERYELTQSIANCHVIIGLKSSDCVLADDDASPKMKEAADLFAFMEGHCLAPVTEGNYDTVCYNTSVTEAFSS